MAKFVKTNAKEFNLSLITILYTTLIQLHLEYASILWNPIFNIDNQKIENVQK